MTRAVVLAPQAASALERLGSRPHGMLCAKLAAIARLEHDDGLLTVWTRSNLAACEVVSRRGPILVYAVVSVRDMLTILYGDELDRRFRTLALWRLLHGRR